MINETMAQRYFKNEDPLGKRILVQRIVPARPELGEEVPWQVVGVIADEKVGDLDDTSAGIYVSYAQSPVTNLGLVVRGALDPTMLTKSIGAAIRDVNKNQAITDIKTIEEIKSDSLGANRQNLSAA